METLCVLFELVFIFFYYLFVSQRNWQRKKFVIIKKTNSKWRIKTSVVMLTINTNIEINNKDFYKRKICKIG